MARVVQTDLSALGWPNGVVPKCGLQEAGEPASVSKRERHWCHSQRQVALQLLTTPPRLLLLLLSSQHPLSSGMYAERCPPLEESGGIVLSNPRANQFTIRSGLAVQLLVAPQR